MLLDYFLRIKDFAHLPRAELRALAVTAHVVCVPAGRQLLAEGQLPRDYLYLMRGKVLVEPGGQKLGVRRSGAIAHFFPGCARARTLTNCHILRVSAMRRDFALHRCADDGIAPSALSEAWLQKFLQSHMMRSLSAGQWQRVLASFSPQQVSAGGLILRRGERGEQCYVVESGHGLVQRHGRTLSHLIPGDFFGEDSLILNGARNADVVALSPMKLHTIDRLVFLQELVGTLVEPVTAVGQGEVLVLGEGLLRRGRDVAQELDSVRQLAARLPADRRLYVTGGDAASRALVAFLFGHKGLRAHPVEPIPDVRQESYDRLPIAAGQEYSLRAARKSGRSD